MALGAVVAPLLTAACWMIVLFYADRLGGFDTGNNRFSDVIVGSVLGAPVVGLVVGALVVRVRRRRAVARAGPRDPGPARGGRPRG
jgi:hypothetical protein